MKKPLSLSAGQSTSGAKETGAFARLWPFLAGLLFLAVFWTIGFKGMSGYALDLGSLGLPRVRYGLFLAFWSLFGTLAAGFFALGIIRLMAKGDLASRFHYHLMQIPDSRWILLISLAAFTIPATVRALVLHGAPLTDDEGCYRFSSELLASGRLYADSHPLKLFFDHAFMINDGKYYSQYPLGWPALMVPGTLLGVSGYVNAIYSAATLPGIFLLMRRMTSSFWARVGTSLYLFSPFIVFAASTEMSHTSCMLFLTWTAWAVFRSRDQGAPLWTHALAAIAFSVAFFVRPSSALGIGIPLLFFWLLGIWRNKSGTVSLKKLAVFLIPAAAMAGLFLLVNQVQNGSPFYLSYQRVLDYSRENGYRFSNWFNLPEGTVANYKFGDPIQALSHTGIAVFRLNFALLGWPLSLLYVFFAKTKGIVVVLWACVVSFLALHFFATDSGIDTLGPVHYFEMSLPLLVLTVVGARDLSERLTRLSPGVDPAEGDTLRRLPLALMVALIAVNLLGYFQVRAGAISSIAADVRSPIEFLERAKVHNAVVFAMRPYTPQCISKPTKHFVFWKPLNDPDMKNDIVWANHVSLEEDRKLMDHLPGREGYLLLWRTDCSLEILPLAKANPDLIPDGIIGGFHPDPDNESALEKTLIRKPPPVN